MEIAVSMYFVYIEEEEIKVEKKEIKKEQHEINEQQEELARDESQDPARHKEARKKSR